MVKIDEIRQEYHFILKFRPQSSSRVPAMFQAGGGGVDTNVDYNDGDHGSDGDE